MVTPRLSAIADRSMAMKTVDLSRLSKSARYRSWIARRSSKSVGGFDLIR
jgi:hypothetical protein